MKPPYSAGTVTKIAKNLSAVDLLQVNEVTGCVALPVLSRMFMGYNMYHGSQKTVVVPHVKHCEVIFQAT